MMLCFKPSVSVSFGVRPTKTFHVYASDIRLVKFLTSREKSETRTSRYFYLLMTKKSLEQVRTLGDRTDQSPKLNCSRTEVDRMF